MPLARTANLCAQQHNGRKTQSYIAIRAQTQKLRGRKAKNRRQEKEMSRRPRRQAKLSRRPGCNGREESGQFGKGEDMQTGRYTTFIHKPHTHTHTQHNHTHLNEEHFLDHSQQNPFTQSFVQHLLSQTAHLHPCLKVQGRPHAGYTKMNQRRSKEIITFPSFLPCQYAFTIGKCRPHPLLNKRGAHLFFLTVDL